MTIAETLKLARLADADGHHATAFEMFRRVMALDPSKDAAIYSAFGNLLEIGRVSDAERYLNQIRRNAAPKPWLIEVALGKLRLAQIRDQLERKSTSKPLGNLAEIQQRLRSFLQIAYQNRRNLMKRAVF